MNDLSKEQQQAQRANLVAFYDQVADQYDESIYNKSSTKILSILTEFYKKYNITSGVVLDIGCGTGKIQDYLGNAFTYKGIDISEKMLELSRKRGFETYAGPAEEVLSSLDDKSVDHVAAVSSLDFIEDFDGVIAHIERVARKSFFASLEQFQPKVIQAMSEKGIKLYNHSASKLSDPKEVLSNIFLWKRPSTGDEIYGDVVFKQF